NRGTPSSRRLQMKMETTFHKGGNTIKAMLVALALCACAGAAAAAETSSSTAPASGHPPVVKKKPSAVPAFKLIDINSASREQLKTLPGIGDAEAAKIIAGRPYLSKADLASNKILPTGVYLSIRKLIIARQTGTPKPRK
ncbi:MAG: ComEA family DNA-binding protein, partial [Gemmatimonadota bacterium]